VNGLVLRWRLWLRLAAARVGLGAILGPGLWRDRDRLQAQALDQPDTQTHVIEDKLTRQLGRHQPKHSVRAAGFAQAA